MHNYSFIEIFGGILAAAVVIGVLVFVCLLILKSGNKAGKKFKEENPNVATIYIVNEQYFGIKIKKADGNKVVGFQNSIGDASGGTYFIPGEHVLSLEHFHADPAVNKDSDFKKQKKSTMSVNLESGKEYTLLFSELPGGYKLVDGRPESGIVFPSWTIVNIY